MKSSRNVQGEIASPSKTNLRRRRQRGNVLIEFALVMTPFFALALTTIELSLPIFKKSTFEDAVREGCRYGITYQTLYNGTTYGTQTEAIQAVVQANSMGFITDTSMISVKYYNSVTFTDVTTQSNANADGNIIQVSISGYTHNWIAPVAWFWGSTTFQINPAPLTIVAVSADRLESLPPGNKRPSP